MGREMSEQGRELVVKGRIVEWSRVGACLLWIGGLWLGGVGAVGILVLRRRELARVQV